MNKNLKNEENIKIFKNNGYIYKLILFILLIISFIIGYFSGKLKLKNKKEIFLLDELLNFKSYSQCYEDLILFCIFYNVKKGFYIDVGANDPNQISVTKAFYLRGWNGINFEPLPDKYKLLLKERKKDLNLQIGVGNEIGNFSFFLKGTGSTLSKIYVKRKTKILNIKVNTLSNICKQYLPKEKKIQFCKIDVEGGEKNVLLGYDFKNYRPEVFCIESTKPGTRIPCHDLWEDILLKNNYSFVYQYKINRYYIDNRIEGLKERFYHVNKYIKLYKLLNN